MANEMQVDSDVVNDGVEQRPLKFSVWNRHSTLLSIGLMLFLLMAFYYPVWFGGKAFMPPDGVNIRCAVPFVNEALERGVFPLWNPYICGGMPSFASMYMVPRSDWLGFVFKAFNVLVSPLGEPSYFMRLGLNYLLLGALLFGFLRDRKIEAGAALVAAVGLLFAPPVVAFAVFSHTGKLLTAALIPAIFLFSHRLLEKRRILDLCLLGIVVGFQLLRSHVQISYYTMMMVGLYWIYWIVGEFQKRERPARVAKGTAMLGVAFVAGLAMSSFLSLSVWQYSQYSVRGGGGSGLGYQSATNWSLHPLEMINLIIPSFTGFGGSSYWGPMPFTDYPIYFGLVMIVLAGLAMVIRRERITWFFAGLFVFSLVVAFGKYLPILYGPMYEYLPLFNRFRVPNMISILMIFSVAVLAGFGMDSLIKLARCRDTKRITAVQKYFLISGGVVVALYSVLFFSKMIYLQWAAKAGSQAPAAYEMAMSDGLRAMLLFGATSGLILFSLKGRRAISVMPFVVIALILIDVWPVNHRFMKKQIRPDDSVEQIFAETPDVTFLKSQQKPFRIMTVNDSRSPNWYMHHFIENVGGYHSAKLKTYQEFMDRFTVGGIFPKNYVQQTAQGVGLRNPESLSPSEVNAQIAFFKMMNIKYLVSPLPLHQLDSSLSEVVVPKIKGQNGVFVYERALPRIWFPTEVITVADQGAVLDHMAGGEFDPEITAILEDSIAGIVGDVSQNTATIESTDIHRMVVKADVKNAGLLVFSEIYYPAGWNATVDGEPTKIYETDYLLRSVWLEPGEHLIEMNFRPVVFRLGLAISLLALMFLAAGAVLAWRMAR